MKDGLEFNWQQTDTAWWRVYKMLRYLIDADILNPFAYCCNINICKSTATDDLNSFPIYHLKSSCRLTLTKDVCKTHDITSNKTIIELN